MKYLLSLRHAAGQALQSARIVYARKFNTELHQRAQRLEAQFLARVGVAPPDDDPADHAYSPTMAPQDNDQSANMPGVFDQLTIGDCTGNTITAFMMYCLKVAGLPVAVLARLFPYWWSRYYDGTTGDVGATPRSMCRAVKNKGICTEDLMPYSSFDSAPGNAALTDALRRKLLAFSVIKHDPDDTHKTHDTMSSARAEGNVVAFAFICKRWMFYMSGPLFSSGHLPPNPMPAGMDDDVGGHIVITTGNNADWNIFQNSWGTGWGDNGRGSFHRLLMYGNSWFPMDVRVLHGAVIDGQTITLGPVPDVPLTLGQIADMRATFQRLRLGTVQPDGSFAWTAPVTGITYHVAIEAMKSVAYSYAQMEQITGLPAANIQAFAEGDPEATAAYRAL